jgi:hypothetical protein
VQILLDELPCDVEAATVAEAVMAVAALARERGRLIVDVVVDGTRWNGDAAPPAGAASVVALTSTEPAALVRETFAHAAEALVEADGLQRAAAESLQSDRAVEAMDNLAGAMAIWDGVREAIVSAATLGALGGGAAAPAEAACPDLEPAVALLQGRLEALRTALQRGDTVAVSDALLYEFPEVVARWRALLEALRGQVK